MRPAAFESAGPEPDVIREQQRDAALAFMRKDKERFCIRPLHHGCSVGAAGVHDAKPLAPMRRLIFGAVKPARYRMALPEVSELRAKRPIGDVATRLCRQNGIKRR